MPLFGTDGIINHLTMIFAVVYVLGALLFRKNVSNDFFGYGFSVIGSSFVGILFFILMDSIFGMFKLSILVSFVGWLAGGFLLGGILGDGDAE